MRSRHEACPLCGASEIRDMFLVDGFTVSRCHACSLVFVRDKVSAAELDRFYSTAPPDHVYSDPHNVTNLSYCYGLLRRLIEREVSGGSLLDVGCSAGQFLDVLDDRWEAHGIEISPQQASRAQQRHGSRVFNGTLAQYSGRDGSFDVVTLLDVLDHSPTPREDLLACARLLRTGGIVVIKVHNIDCLFARVMGRRFYAITPPSHLFYFNRRTLDRLLSDCGYEMVGVHYLTQRIALKTVPYRLARGRSRGFFHGAFRLLDRSAIGDIPVYKNLRDLITVVGRRV